MVRVHISLGEKKIRYRNASSERIEKKMWMCARELHVYMRVKKITITLESKDLSRRICIKGNNF